MNATWWSPWKRRIRKTLLVVLLIVALPVGAHFFLRWSAAWDLNRASAEADRLDPGWQLLQIEDNRETVPDAENSALQIMRVKRRMPQRWPNSPRINLGPGRTVYQSDLEIDLEEQIARLTPYMQLSPDVIRVARGVMKTMARVLEDARKLAHLPRGRYPIQIAPNLQDMSPSSGDVMTLAKLLWADAVTEAQERHVDQALESTLAILNVGRSIGDEPILGSQTQRLVINIRAIRTLERVLAQGSASDTALRDQQLLLEDEAAQPVELNGFRGERATVHYQFSRIFSGELRMRMLFFHGNLANRLPKQCNQYVNMVIIRRAYPEYLRLLTALVEVAKLPVEEQAPRIRSLNNQAGSLPIEFRSWFNTSAPFTELNRKNQAGLRCAIAGIAAERYRLANKEWPKSLIQMAPEFLKEIPIDPYDSQPLRLRRLEHSILIYSIGSDESAVGRNLTGGNDVKGGDDIGFQLWDLEYRHQPWRPPPPKEEEDEKDQ